jgi:hypothetical protein
MPAVNSSIMAMELRMSRRGWSGVLEDKFGLTVEVALDLFLQAIGIAQIGFHAENVGHHILQADEVNQRQAFRLIELRGHIDIGIRCCFPPYDGTVQVQVNDPCRPEARAPVVIVFAFTNSLSIARCLVLLSSIALSRSSPSMPLLYAAFQSQGSGPLRLNGVAGSV